MPRLLRRIGQGLLCNPRKKKEMRKSRDWKIATALSKGVEQSFALVRPQSFVLGAKRVVPLSLRHFGLVPEDDESRGIFCEEYWVVELESR